MHNAYVPCFAWLVIRYPDDQWLYWWFPELIYKHTSNYSIKNSVFLWWKTVYHTFLWQMASGRTSCVPLPIVRTDVEKLPACLRPILPRIMTTVALVTHLTSDLRSTKWDTLTHFQRDYMRLHGFFYTDKEVSRQPSQPVNRSLHGCSTRGWRLFYKSIWSKCL